MSNCEEHARRERMAHALAEDMTDAFYGTTNATTAAATFDQPALDALFSSFAEASSAPKSPIGFVCRPSALARLERLQRDTTPTMPGAVSSFFGIPFHTDAQQTEDCLAFYDLTLLRLYLRRNDSPASLRAYAAELAAQIAARMPQTRIPDIAP